MLGQTHENWLRLARRNRPSHQTSMEEAPQGARDAAVVDHIGIGQPQVVAVAPGREYRLIDCSGTLDPGIWSKHKSESHSPAPSINQTNQKSFSMVSRRLSDQLLQCATSGSVLCCRIRSDSARTHQVLRHRTPGDIKTRDNNSPFTVVATGTRGMAWR